MPPHYVSTVKVANRIVLPVEVWRLLSIMALWGAAGGWFLHLYFASSHSLSQFPRTIMLLASYRPHSGHLSHSGSYYSEELKEYLEASVRPSESAFFVIAAYFFCVIGTICGAFAHYYRRKKQVAYFRDS